MSSEEIESVLSDEVLNRLRVLAVSLTEDSNLAVVSAPDQSTSSTDMKEAIYLSEQPLPNGITNKKLRIALMEGTNFHEASHWRWTKPVDKQYTAWSDSKRIQDGQELANTIVNIVEDCRIDRLLMERFRTTFGPRRRQYIDIIGKTIEEEVVKVDNKKKSYDTTKPNRLTMAVNAWLTVSKFGRKTKMKYESQEEREVVEKVILLTAQAKKAGRLRASKQLREKSPGIIDLMDDIYSEFIKLWDPEELDKSKMPKSEGGSRQLVGENPEEAEEAEADGDGDSEGSGDSDSDGEDGDAGQGRGGGYGKGTGLEIPHPKPNPVVYNRLVQKNEPIIRKMLKRLKQATVLKSTVARFIPHGRLMTELATQLITQSYSREVTNVFARRKLQEQRTEVAIGLLVDLSGSMNIPDAMNVLTTITEVGGRWLKEHDLAVLVFGSDYQKIKVFPEQFWNTRARIGGLQCMGGTEMYPPLREYIKIFKTIETGKRKVLIIVSDFETSNEEETKRHIALLTRMGVLVIGIGFSAQDEQANYCINNTWIDNIGQLPEKFFYIWKRVTDPNFHV